MATTKSAPIELVTMPVVFLRRQQRHGENVFRGVRSHRCEQLLGGLGNGSRLLRELGALGGKLSDLTKFSLAPPANRAIVSDMAKHDADLSLLFHALADPTRRSILTRLAETPARVTDLAGPTGLRLPTVMRHLSVLEEAGLIATSKDGRIRTCAIVPEALDPVRTWLDEHRAIWETRLDRLDAFVMNLMKESKE
jgi:DNA-binding transcriptional ArsR family regulator